ncbi:MAG TPA: carboxypeptidase regulatory-like domain-containing protein, partial [Flavisolibacter sp.]|nr:carboxypeptidase regulatory-like domain-containing protein [Flavisolibacter sp.]
MITVPGEIDAIPAGYPVKPPGVQAVQVASQLPVSLALLLFFLFFQLTALANTGPESGSGTPPHNSGRQSLREIPLFEPAETTGFAADTVIRGRVTDSAGAPLQGVSVAVRGTQIGVTTTAAGEFVVRGAPANAVLEVSNVGYEMQEIAIRPGQTTLTVAMQRSQGLLADVIITGFQRINRKNFTGAAATLKADDVKIEGMADVSRMLEGRAAGVSVQNVSSTFGTAPKVRIRGATSINGENKPLWVVDGVVLEDIVNISNDQL